MVSPAKKALIELSTQIAEDCSWDDAMYALYVRQKIQQGLKDLEQGRVVAHDDVFQEYGDGDTTSPLDAIGAG